MILLPTEAGVVTTVNGDTLTLTGFDGASHTVDVTGQTRYQKAGMNAALSDVTTGTAIVAEGTLGSNGPLTAVRVTIQEPRVAGRVTAVNGSTYTVTGGLGVTYSVTASGSTTYVNPDGASATASAVKTGTFIAAEGMLSADGKTLAAQRIVVVPAGTAFGGGRHHRFGDGGLGFGNGSANGGAPGATAPAATGTQNV